MKGKRLKMDLYVARSDFRISKPCVHCCELLKHFGIHRVIYTTSDGSYICEKVKELTTTHTSHGDKYYKSIV